MKTGIERVIRGLSMANKIRLGPDQLPEIYRILPPTCQALGIDERVLPGDGQATRIPHQGDTRIFINVTSGLIEMLEEDELRAVVAHECGHITCRHVLYRTMAQMMLEYGAQISARWRHYRCRSS